MGWANGWKFRISWLETGHQKPVLTNCWSIGADAIKT